MMPQVRRILLHRDGLLARLFRRDGSGREHAAWHFDVRACEGCANFEDCEAESFQRGSVSQIPGLSAADAQGLKDFVAAQRSAGGAPVSDIEDLCASLSRAPGVPPGSALARAASGRLSLAEASLVRRALRARLPEPGSAVPSVVPVPATLAAVQMGVPVCRGTPTTLLARSEETAIFLSIVNDPFTHGLAAWVIAEWSESEGGRMEAVSHSAPQIGERDRFSYVLRADADNASSLLIAALRIYLGRASGRPVTLYCWTEGERTCLLDICIRGSLLGDEAADFCARALVTDARAIALPAPLDVHVRELQQHHTPSDAGNGTLSPYKARSMPPSSGFAGGDSARPVSTSATSPLRAPDGMAAIEHAGAQTAPRLGRNHAVDSIEGDDALDVEGDDDGKDHTVAFEAALYAPRFVALSTALHALVALPFQRATDVGGALACLEGAVEVARARYRVVPNLYDEWRSGRAAPALDAHVGLVRSLLRRLREFVVHGERALGTDVLLCAAPRLLVPPSVMNDPTLRRMVFVREYEAIAKAEKLQRARINGDVVRMRVVRRVLAGEVNTAWQRITPTAAGLPPKGAHLLVCEVLEGAGLLRNANSEQDHFFSPRTTGDSSSGGGAVDVPEVETEAAEIVAPIAPAAAAGPTAAFYANACYFRWVATSTRNDQLAYSDLLHMSAKSYPHSSEQSVALAEVFRFPFAVSAADPPNCVLIAFESGGGKRAKKGDMQRKTLLSEMCRAPGLELLLSERLYDSNTQKVVSHLRRIDRSGSPGHLLSLLDDTINAARARPYPELRERPLPPGSLLALDASQEAALRGVFETSVSVAWGPPGTGKTHCLAATILRLVRAAFDAHEPLQVLFTAFSNAAIDELSMKIDKLAAACDDEPWLRALKPRSAQSCVSRIVTGTKMTDNDFTKRQIAISAGTLWAIHNKFGSAGTFLANVVVIDEASQVLVSDAALALTKLHPAGRLLVAGDDEQLGPIIENEWPSSGALTPVHLSILACFRQRVERLRASAPAGAPPVIYQLLSCRRMNRDLVSLSQRIYGAAFYSVHPERSLTRGAMPLSFTPAPPLAAIFDALLRTRSPDSLVRVRLIPPADGAELDLLHKEATAVAAIVLGLLRAAVADGDALTARSFFIVTPHRKQRTVVRSALCAAAEDFGVAPSVVAEILVDTTEKIQGQECEIVVGCWGSLSAADVSAESDFILSRRRLNVAVTRARRAAILVVADAVANPPPECGVLLSKGKQDAAEFLADFCSMATTVDW